MSHFRSKRSIHGGVVLAVALSLISVVAPVAQAADVQKVNSNAVQVTSDLHTINHSQTIFDVEYDCPSDFPVWTGEFHNNSTGAVKTIVGSIGVTATLDPLAAVGAIMGKFYVTFTDWALTGDQQYGITYTCHRYATLADCGGEGQRVCWGAVKSNGSAADDMYQVLGDQSCDRGLVTDGNIFAGDKSTCKDSTRHVLHSSEANDASHDTRVLDEQAYQLGADEPMNLVVRPRTHESYNDRNDNYVAPNQEYSLSDQLDAGVRFLDLRARWGVAPTPYLRMSHGDNTCHGCSPFDRPLNYGIEEVGQWLKDNSQQVITLSIGQFDGKTVNDRDYVIDPVAKYLGDRVLGPREWCNYLASEPMPLFPTGGGPGTVTTQTCQGVTGQIKNDGAGHTTWKPYRWPTLAEMRNPKNWACGCTKQVIIDLQGDGDFQDAKWFFDVALDDHNTGSSDARDFVASTCTRGNTKYDVDTLGKSDYLYNWVTTAEARVIGQAVATHDNPPGSDRWPGYVYALHSDIPTTPTLVNNFTSGRPYQNDATSIEDLLNCNISASLDMFMADQFYNGDMVDIPPDHLRRDAMVWTWKNDDDLQANKCALLGASDNAFHANDCGEKHPVACALPSTANDHLFRAGEPWNWQDPMGKNWKVTANAYTFSEAQPGCQKEFGSWVFAVPTNKFMENQLQSANTRHQDVWLAYTNNVAGSGPAWKKWTIARQASIGLNNFTVAQGSSITLQAQSNLPLDQLSPVWSWLSGGQWHTAAGATAVFSPSGVPGGALVPVELTVTDKLGLTTTASSLIMVTPGGFSLLDARLFSYGRNTGAPAFTHGFVGHTLTVTPDGTGTLMLDVLRNPAVTLPAGLSATASSAFYNAAFTPDSAFSSLKFVACEPSANTVLAFDTTSGSWFTVPDQSFDKSSGCITFMSAPQSGVHLDDLSHMVFAFENDTTPPWDRAFLKTADHRMYLPNTVANQDVEVIIMANDDGGSGVAHVFYTLTPVDPPGYAVQNVPLAPNDSIWLRTNGKYSLSYFAVDNAGNASATQTISNIIISK